MIVRSRVPHQNWYSYVWKIDATWCAHARPCAVGARTLSPPGPAVAVSPMHCVVLSVVFQGWEAHNSAIFLARSAVSNNVEVPEGISRYQYELEHSEAKVGRLWVDTQVMSCSCCNHLEPHSWRASGTRCNCFLYCRPLFILVISLQCLFTKCMHVS